MPTPTSPIEALNIKELLSSDANYIIPIYQRNYAWESKEIEQLIQDIIDYSIHHKNKNYYIGTLVVAPILENENADFRTIDGQQRLTTLSILTAVLKNSHKDIDMSWYTSLCIHFESREKSASSMEAVFSGVFEDSDDIQYEEKIRSAYDICSSELIKKTNENNISVQDFANYFYEFVKILRVPLPAGIDLNHYFEIMNSRGEQLEKHEILKAKLMDCFNVFDQEKRQQYEGCFDLIWQACSNMEKYVQYGFSPEQRHLLFGEKNWNDLTVFNFDEIVEKLNITTSETRDQTVLTIDEIIKGPIKADKQMEQEDSPDRFNSVVNFQNFLLHVLRVQTAKDSVALDDKRLIDLFDQEFPVDPNERIEFSKEFIYNLLKCKFLFDKYIIKREFTANTDRWSLKSLKWYKPGKSKDGVKYTNTFGEEQNESFDSDNRRVLMLLSMFHVSIPSMVYKYWLNAALNYLFNQFVVESKEYITYLEHIAKSFVYDRYLANEEKDYYEMIYENLQPISRTISQLDLGKLRFHHLKNNLVFNFVDYLLWSNLKDTEKDGRVKSFEYTFRSSVEHYYPQNPINKVVDEIDKEHLHSFGNLCLISHEKNSKLNNYSPTAKQDHYQKATSLDSIKQYLMMKRKHWAINEIDAHNLEMEELLVQNMSSNYTFQKDISLAKQWFNEFRVRDKILLMRTLLCFEDCTTHVSGNKFRLFDFEKILEGTTFQLFEDYINNKSPKNLSEIINKNLQYQSLKKDWRFLFVKYPKVLEYCEEGNILFEEEGNSFFIHLLKSEKRTKWVAKEIYNLIMHEYLFKAHSDTAFCDYECLNIRIGFNNNEEYYLAVDPEEADLLLRFWNEGASIHYDITSLVNGNFKSVKNLTNFGWERREQDVFERNGKSKLLTLGENFEENILLIEKEMFKLLKNGLGIKLSWIT